MFTIGSQRLQNAQAVCIGSGRFLRAFLLPMFERLHVQAVVAQPRGTDFVTHMVEQGDAGFEMDVVGFDGQVVVHRVRNVVVGACSLSDPDGRRAFMSLAHTLPALSLIVIGVTEAGLAPDAPAISDLATFLLSSFHAHPDRKLSVLNTDNLPDNGATIGARVRASAVAAGAGAAFLQWLDEHVHFVTSVVDRIVAARPDQPLIPRTEPLPRRALVLDREVLPQWSHLPGVLVRPSRAAVLQDQALKLRLLNATHTALVYTLALAGGGNTQQLGRYPELVTFLELLYGRVLGPAAARDGLDSAPARDALFADWMQRLLHPAFGMDVYFVAQNSTLKLGARLLPSAPLLRPVSAEEQAALQLLAFAFAAAWRYLTPLAPPAADAADDVFTGRTDAPGHGARYEYTRGLHADPAAGTYEFRDGAGVVPQTLALASPADAAGMRRAVLECMQAVHGFDAAAHEGHAALAEATAELYACLRAEPALVVLDRVLRACDPSTLPSSPTAAWDGPRLTGSELAAAVQRAVREAPVIDLHTHLFPPSHGSLCLWGIDRLLTYHYLVSEYFITAPAHTSHAAFLALPVRQQADRIWQALFVDRTPISEACRGVLTVLQALGLREEAERRDLAAIRRWYAGQTPAALLEKACELAGVRYAVMTNIPFDLNEAHHWRAGDRSRTPRLRTALRVDTVLTGDWTLMLPALQQEGLLLPASTVAAAAAAAVDPDSLPLAEREVALGAFLDLWVQRLQPEYLMASLPVDFAFPSTESVAARMLDRVLIPLARRHRLPVALKVGALRRLVPALGDAGDALTVSDPLVLARVCNAYPDVKFLATFLSRVSQHSAAVVAQKCRNLHLYGCWWFCNTPSMVREITEMRIELLGTAFTAQHSDCRVVEHLIYKWAHARQTLAEVLVPQYQRLAETGWVVTEAQIRRDVARWLGGAYEEFMSK